MKYREIERLRGIAVFMTFCSHVQFKSLLPATLSDPWGGVDLFFVISGFVVTLSLLRLLPEYAPHHNFLTRLRLTKTAWSIFYIKRLYRIVPLAFCIALIYCAAYSFKDGNIKNSSRELLGVFSGLYNYGLAAGYYKGYLAFYWSLAVEEHFYFLLPIFLVVFPSLNSRIRGAIATIACVVFIVRPISFMSLDATSLWNQSRAVTHVRVDALLAGTLLAFAAQKFGHNKMRSNWLFQTIAYVCTIFVWIVPSFSIGREGDVSTLFFVSIWASSAVLVYFASADAGIVFEIPVVGKFLEYLGSRSYALYLCLTLVLRLIDYAFHIEHLVLPASLEIIRACAALGISMIFSEILYRFIERPFIEKGVRRITALKNADAKNPIPSQQRDTHAA